jgi:predicted TIM-barrel fold metal-dependent hydrolase
MQPRAPEQMQEIVARMRQIGMNRLLWGSDAPMAEAWDGFGKHVPLTDRELRAIADNVAPYLQNRKLPKP